jgi:hypothetical protein
VIAWLWDAQCLASAAHGITNDCARARQAVAACLRAAGGGTARVEYALLVPGHGTLTLDYARTGVGWTAQHHQSGRVSWTPITASRAEAAAS